MKKTKERNGKTLMVASPVLVLRRRHTQYKSESGTTASALLGADHVLTRKSVIAVVVDICDCDGAASVFAQPRRSYSFLCRR